ncbi:MAG: fibronectin type III domain-containing protein, partial [Bacteroidota bacterium]
VMGGTLPAPPIDLLNLASGTKYNVRIYQDCGEITSDPLPLTFTTTGPMACPTPAGRIEAVTDGTASLLWPAQPGSYELWYRAGTGAPWMKEQLELGPQPLEDYSILLAGLASGTRYVVRLYRRCDEIASAPFTSSFRTLGEAVCDPPLVEVQGVGIDEATVQWDGSGDRYILRYRSGLFGEWTRIEEATSPIVLTSLEPGTPYLVRVFSVCDGVTSIAGGASFETAGESSCHPAPTTITNVTESEARMVWDMQNGTEYALRYRPGPTSDWIDVEDPVSPVELTGLTSGTTYNTQLYTLCGALTSEASTNDFTTLGTVPCEAPVVRIEEIGDTEATITWTGQGDLVNIWYRPGVLSPWTKKTANASPVMLEDLETGTNYQVRVFIDCAGVSSVPDTEFFTTEGQPVCPRPSLTLGAITETSLDLSWTETSGDYAIWYRPVGDTWTEIYDISVTSYTIEELKPATNYELRLYAICGDINAQQVAAEFTTAGTTSARQAQSLPAETVVSQESIQLYPIPTDRQLYFHLPFPEKPLGRVSILDLSGKIWEAEVIKEGNEYSIDVGGLAEGSYVLKLNGAQERVHRFIILR